MKKSLKITIFILTFCIFSSLQILAKEKRPKLVDLGAEHCMACKKIAPILAELKNEYKGQLDVEFIDVWQKENTEKAKEYGIRLIPTQIFISADGKELWRHEGFISKKDILDKWKELGVKIKANTKVLPSSKKNSHNVTEKTSSK